MALRDLLLDELRDMYRAENQLVKALPKLVKGAKDGALKQLFKDHLEETKGQVLRLREVFKRLEEKPTGQHCNGMEGIIEEGADALEKDEEGPSFDSGLIGAALRTEIPKEQLDSVADSIELIPGVRSYTPALE